MITLILLAIVLVAIASFPLWDYWVRADGGTGLSYRATIVLDSITHRGARLTTFRLVIPKWLQAELNTHRALSRNSSSSRAVPIWKIIRQVLTNPVIPLEWGQTSRGMFSNGELSGWRRFIVRQCWLAARYPAVLFAYLMYKCRLHKQVGNRILEPWTWVEVVVTATDYDNFFAQRRHHDAQPEFRDIADRMWVRYLVSEPRVLNDGEWHLPFISTEERWGVGTIEEKIKISIARCARSSAFQAEGYRSAILDLALYKRLRTADPPHWSPFEHVARPNDDATEYTANFQGWESYRKVLEREAASRTLAA